MLLFKSLSNEFIKKKKIKSKENFFSFFNEEEGCQAKISFPDNIVEEM